jgi:hypothetical protein
MSEPRWLLLAHQLPTRSSNARVRTWRRLQQLGAVPSRNSVYVLPNTEQCREDFEWLRTEIVAAGGEATVFAADAISNRDAEDIVKAFQESRTQDYKALQKDINRLLTPARRKKGGGGGPRLTRALRALRDRLDALDRTDFFRAAAREGAAAALAELARKVEGERPPKPPARAPTRRADFQGRRWVTRRRPGVDRMASAWLIRRFIDPRATFAFVDKAAAADVPFDMYDTSHGFGHRGGLCTFEVLCEEFGIVDAPARQVAHIVHDLDLKEKTYAAPESVAIGRMIDGLRAMHADDATLLEQGIGMFEALARSFEA